MKALATFAVVMLLVASCNEHFPRRLDDAEASRDAAAPSDASTSGDAAPVIDDAGADGTTLEASVDAEAGPPIGDAGSCDVTLASFAIEDSTHVPEGSAVTYTSNPPSSGHHYPIWANFQEFTTEVPDGYLVHSLEHGAVLLLYNCAAGDPACDKLVADLRAVRAAIPTDPLCDASIRVRVIIAPRKANLTAVAAAAWGQTYGASCVDVTSLTKFVNDHYAKATEDFCFAGQVAF